MRRSLFLIVLLAMPAADFAQSPSPVKAAPAAATKAAPVVLADPAPSPVADAAMKGDLARVRALIANKTDVNAAQPDGSTALHWAAHFDNIEMAVVLLKAGANPKAATRLGATPLYLASVNGNAAMIEKLLAAGADPNDNILEHGETPLMFAARSGSVESVRLLLNAGAKPAVTETREGTAALSWAAEENHAQIVALLLDHGAAADARSTPVVPRARPQRRRPPVKNEVTKKDEGAVLQAAAQKILDDAAAALPPDANATGGVTALMLAVREGAMETVKVLLDHGAPINETSANGSTALLVALENGDAPMARFLIERGADINLANAKGWTPLYMAIKARNMEEGTMPNPTIDKAGMLEVIRMMLDRNVDVNARLKADTEIHNGIAATWLREGGATAFLRASASADLEVMKLLLAHGADPKINASDGTTALMALSGVGFTQGFMHDFGPPEQSLEALHLLLDIGFDVNAHTVDGVTALHGAANKNFAAAIQLLVDRGADLTAVSHRVGPFELGGNSGKTVLDWATGVSVAMQSPVYHPDSVAMVLKLMKEKNIPIKTFNTTKGGLGSGGN